MTNLPLGSFKRDEIYTFLGGLYVSTFWIVFHSHFYKTNIPNYSDSFFAILFLLLWLNGALLVYFVNSICGFLQRLVNEAKLSRMGPGELAGVLKLNVGLPIYYSRQMYDELFIAAHIDTVVFSSLFLTILPLFLLKTIFLLKAGQCSSGELFLFFTIASVAIVYIVFYLVKRQWIQLYALSFLHSSYNELLFYDVNEVAKHAASNFANSVLAQFNTKVQLRLNPVVTASVTSNSDIGVQAMLIGLNGIVSQL
ncbi:MAG: hypothetical protein U1F66_11135 [bacterium]